MSTRGFLLAFVTAFVMAASPGAQAKQGVVPRSIDKIKRSIQREGSAQEGTTRSAPAPALKSCGSSVANCWFTKKNIGIKRGITESTDGDQAQDEGGPENNFNWRQLALACGKNCLKCPKGDAPMSGDKCSPTGKALEEMTLEFGTSTGCPRLVWDCRVHSCNGKSCTSCMEANNKKYEKLVKEGKVEEAADIRASCERQACDRMTKCEYDTLDLFNKGWSSHMQSNETRFLEYSQLCNMAIESLKSTLTGEATTIECGLERRDDGKGWKIHLGG